MNTRDFLTTLDPYQDRALTFEIGGEIGDEIEDGRIQPGYHVTEIKAVSVRSVDCGGQESAWAETVIQLWTPERSNEHAMSVGKFLSIYRRVASRVPTEEDAEVRLEVGEQGAPAVSYFVANIRAEGQEVVVKLEPPLVACKALGTLSLTMLENAADDLPVIRRASDCCTPPSAQKSTKQGACCG